MFFNKINFDRLNGFDENIFLYGEDNDLCCRMIENGYLIIFASNAQGTHLVSKATTSTFRIRWRKEWNIVWSHLYLVKKYENLEAAQFRAKRLLIKHAPKVLFYAILFQPKRFMRDLAIFHAALCFIMSAPPKRSY